jgi:hypothetical protein
MNYLKRELKIKYISKIGRVIPCKTKDCDYVEVYVSKDCTPDTCQQIADYSRSKLPIGIAVYVIDANGRDYLGRWPDVNK